MVQNHLIDKNKAVQLEPLFYYSSREAKQINVLFFFLWAREISSKRKNYKEYFIWLYSERAGRRGRSVLPLEKGSREVYDKSSFFFRKMSGIREPRRRYFASLRGRSNSHPISTKRVTGIEPVSCPWEGHIIPLYDTRVMPSRRFSRLPDFIIIISYKSVRRG